jgi:hypothetical protein
MIKREMPGQKNAFKSRFFRFQTCEEYERKWTDILEDQVLKLLREEATEIQ